MQVNDGNFDCSDWSDECPMNRTITDDVISSKYEMIDGVIYRIMLTIMAFIAVVANAVLTYI